MFQIDVGAARSDTLGMTGTAPAAAWLCAAPARCTLKAKPPAPASLPSPRSLEKITTIEGLSPDRSHPVQRVGIEGGRSVVHGCQSGQIMSGSRRCWAKCQAQRFRKLTMPRRENIRRCGTHQLIYEAVHRAADMHKACATPPASRALIPRSDAMEERPEARGATERKHNSRIESPRFSEISAVGAAGLVIGFHFTRAI